MPASPRIDSANATASKLQRRRPMRTILLVGLLATFGCHDNLVLPDAGGADAIALDAAASCPAPPAPLAPGRSKVYLNTEGVTLSKVGVSCSIDDAQTNCTSLIAQDQTVVPPFLPGVATRQPYIDQIVTDAQGILAPYSIDIVTTRPATGSYQMVVLGGDAVSITGGCPGCSAISLFRCTPSFNVVDLMFDGGTVLPQTEANYANTLVGDIGILSGLVASVEPGDCMCRFDTPCISDMAVTTPCTFGSNEQTTVSTDGNGTPENCGRATEDEPALLEASLGCR